MGCCMTQSGGGVFLAGMTVVSLFIPHEIPKSNVIIDIQTAKFLTIIFFYRTNSNIRDLTCSAISLVTARYKSPFNSSTDFNSFRALNKPLKA